MIFDVVTIFPEFFSSILEHGLLKRARAAGLAEFRLHDLRDFTDDRHRTVDDRPFGGGPGMVFKPQPIFRAVQALRGEGGPLRVVLLSPQGKLLTQRLAQELAGTGRLALVCGRYEGVDERIAEHVADQEISIGDYVLSGGELPAAVLMEAVTRLVPGVLGNEESAEQDSFAPAEGGAAWESSSRAAGGVLDFPHYTRPAEFNGWKVPEVLLSGHHQEIRRWRRRRALEKTWRVRPELLAQASLNDEDQELMEEIRRAAVPAAL
jgi:tRNA (guanine37-N1)-methyltransferase